MIQKQSFDLDSCQGVVYVQDDGLLTVEGKFKSGPWNGRVLYWAPVPAHHGASFSGSGLPFATPEHAFENTPNKGVVSYRFRRFKFQICMPNAYYRMLGSVYVPPHFVFKRETRAKLFNVVLDQRILFRSLTYPSLRVNSSFYGGRDQLPIRTQEEIIRSSHYGLPMPKHFWGVKPPQ